MGNIKRTANSGIDPITPRFEQILKQIFISFYQIDSNRIRTQMLCFLENQTKLQTPSNDESSNY